MNEAIGLEIITDGLEFDDVTKDADGNYWSQICTQCTQKHGNTLTANIQDSAMGICGVKDCDNEAEEYIDFDSNNIQLK